MENDSTMRLCDKELDSFDLALKEFSGNNFFQFAVNLPFTNKLCTTAIDLGIIVYLRMNEQSHTVDRIAISDTELATGALKASAKPFESIRIPFDAIDNYIVQSIKNREHRITDDWRHLFIPELTPAEARRNQHAASIECSLVWPLASKPGGALIYSFYQPIRSIGEEHFKFAEKYSSLVDNELVSQGS